MFSTPLFAADDDHAQILKELLIDHLSEKELEVCGWVFNDAYPYTLQKLPNNHFYAVVGSDGRCEYGHGSDEESAFNNCEKWKKENSIPGTCKPFAIGKEIVWGKEVEVKIDIYENMDAIKEFCEITKICTEDFFSTYLKAEQHKAIAVVRKLGRENEYFLNLDGWHTGASSREIANTKALEQCEEKKIGFKDLQDYENYECKIIIYNNAIINENYVAWAEKLLKNNYEELKALEKSIPIPDEVSEAFIKMHNRAFDENKKTFVYDDGITYLVGSEKIDIKDAVIKKEKVLVLEEKQDKEIQYHYCLRLHKRTVFLAGKKCSELTSSKDTLMEITEDQFQQIKKEQRSFQTSSTLLSIVDTHVSQNGEVKKIKKIKRAFIIPEDNKKGRSLSDRPDTNSDYKIHVMYILPKNEKDKEIDINGKLEKMVFQMDDMFFKLTSNTKKIRRKEKIKVIDSS